MGIAATGSGKTLAFGLPALAHIRAQKEAGVASGGCGGGWEEGWGGGMGAGVGGRGERERESEGAGGGEGRGGRCERGESVCVCSRARTCWLSGGRAGGGCQARPACSFTSRQALYGGHTCFWCIR